MLKRVIFGGISRIAANLVMLLFAVSCIFPIVWMIYSSLKTQSQFMLNIVALPTVPQFGNYAQAAKLGNLGPYFFNSFYNSVLSVAGALIVSFVTGYVLSRFQFRGRNFLYFYYLSGMLIPIYALLIPIFIEFQQLHLINRQFTLILPYIAFQMPMSVFLTDSYVRSIPMEIEEAAFMDGCSLVKTMFRIIMPICQPVLATSLILSFLGNWNEFPLALVLLNTERLKTLPLGLTNFVGANSTQYTLLLSALVIVTLPVLLIYMLFHKYIIQGMVAGAVKG